MAFMAFLPAIADAVAGTAEEAVGAAAASAGGEAAASSSSGDLGRLGNMAKGQMDGQGKQQKTKPADIMSDIGAEAHRYL